MAIKLPKNITVSSFKKEYVLVTEENIKQAVTIGRNMYVIEPRDAEKMTIRYCLLVRPRIRKGRMECSGDIVHSYTHEWFSPEDESVQDYRDQLKIFENFINEGKLYIKLTDKLAVFKMV